MLGRDKWRQERQNIGNRSGTVGDSTKNEDVFIRIDEEGTQRAVVLEDDGRVAYAYLLDGEAVVSDVWLYNVAEAPEVVNWRDRAAMPFLNPKSHCKEERTPRLRDESDVRCVWSLSGVDVIIDGTLMAHLERDARPGWSKLAARPGPLAKPFGATS
jgi:hypothetical protein